jgi:hypothetical protein
MVATISLNILAPEGSFECMTIVMYSLVTGPLRLVFV